MFADPSISSDTTFLAASIDGTLRIWDRRQPNPIARILPRNVPPWCMNACWSPDGNFIYAGRRNGTVEEFSLHKGFRSAERTFKFPQGSGPVSAVRAMPNGRHLIWYGLNIQLSVLRTMKRLS
jgi:transcriptional activator SPT8